MSLVVSDNSLTGRIKSKIDKILNDSKVEIKNPFILLIGNQSRNKSFSGIVRDLQNMLLLWNNEYKYKNIQILYNRKINSNDKKVSKRLINVINKDSVKYLSNANEFAHYLKNIFDKFNINDKYNKKIDALIIYYCGYCKDSKILFDDAPVSLTINTMKSIITQNGKNKDLNSIPKLFIIDSIKPNINNSSKTNNNNNNNNNNKSNKTDLTNNEFNKLRNIATIYSNLESNEMYNNKFKGGNLTNAIIDVLSNKKSQEYSLRKLLLQIRITAKHNSTQKNSQLIEFNDMLDSTVYLTRN